jgi:hypothetical protein
MPIPEPNYDYEISTLVNYYKDALDKISAELNRIDLTNFDRAQLLVVQKEIKDALDELNSRTNDWAGGNDSTSGGRWYHSLDNCVRGSEYSVGSAKDNHVQSS